MAEALHILYVDDSRFDHELVRLVLAEHPEEYRLTEAASRQEFEELLAAGEYDLVLSDFNILGYEGLAVIRAVKAKDPRVPVVIVTGTGSEEVAVEAMKQGAFDYVLKSAAHLQRLPHTIRAALEDRRLKEERRRLEEQSAFFSQCLLQVQEEERRRVARELHDGVSQTLAAAKLYLKTVEAQLAHLPGAELEAVEGVRQHLDTAIQEIHAISHNLRPSALDDLGLVAAMRSLCREVGERLGIPVEVERAELARRLPEEMETALYRILQEALHNAEKHAETPEVRVRLVQEGEGVGLEVLDKGKGFAEPGVTRGMGLVNMAERARLLGGRLEIESAPGRGTVLRVRVPLRG